MRTPLLRRAALSGSHKRLLTALLLASLLTLVPLFAWAHPLGNFSVNRYSRLELGPRQIDLFYVLDLAEIPTFQAAPTVDSDGDGQISPAESDQYLDAQLAALQSNLHLTINGAVLPLALQAQTLEFPVGQGNLATTRLTAHFTAALPETRGPWQGEYRDDNFADRVGWQEIVVRPATGSQLVDSSAPADDISQELRVYPTDLLQNPLAVSQVSFRFQPGAATTGSTPATAPVTATGSRTPDRLAELITVPTLGPGALLLALLLAFGLGAGHALTPGHGKTIVAAYLVGSRGTARHALFLGLTTTLTHTAGVFALGFITLFLSRYILPEQLYPWLGVLSGLLVVSIGFSLFGQRLRALLKRQSGATSHDLLDHSDEGVHSNPAHPSYHTHLPPSAAGERLTWRSLLALGVSGGLLPCPSALVLLLSAIALQRVAFGLLLILAFSLGLASVLTGIGILMVHAGRLFERIPVQGRLFRALPVASALLIALAGIGITLEALWQTGVLQGVGVVSAGLFSSFGP